MKYLKLLTTFLLLVTAIGCKSDDDGPKLTVTSFSGTVLFYPSMVPVTNGELLIEGRRSGIGGSSVDSGAMVKIDGGTFEVSIETFKEVDSYSMLVHILQGSSSIYTFVGSGEPALQCLPGDCSRFLAGQNYELTILVPCSPDDCVQFPPQ